MNLDFPLGGGQNKRKVKILTTNNNMSFENSETEKKISNEKLVDLAKQIVSAYEKASGASNQDIKDRNDAHLQYEKFNDMLSERFGEKFLRLAVTIGKRGEVMEDPTRGYALNAAYIAKHPEILEETERE